jgi:hypothetical protein
VVHPAPSVTQFEQTAETMYAFGAASGEGGSDGLLEIGLRRIFSFVIFRPTSWTIIYQNLTSDVQK